MPTAAPGAAARALTRLRTATWRCCSGHAPTAARGRQKKEVLAWHCCSMIGGRERKRFHQPTAPVHCKQTHAVTRPSVYTIKCYVLLQTPRTPDSDHRSPLGKGGVRLANLWRAHGPPAYSPRSLSIEPAYITPRLCLSPRPLSRVSVCWESSLSKGNRFGQPSGLH